MHMSLNRKDDGSPISGDVVSWKDLGGYAEVEIKAANGHVATVAVCETIAEVERRFQQEA